jgi:LPS sulfotransferase NodH
MSALRPGSIAMFHVGRSGSTVLGDLLNQHPKILWDGEIYDPFVRGWALGALMKPGDLGLDPIRVLRKRRIRAGARYYGFETKFFHLRLMEVGLPEYVRDLRHNGVDRFVVLERRNYLRKVVSAAVAHERAAFSRAAHDERPRPSRIRLDTEELRIEFSSEPLLAYLEDYREGFARLRELLPEERTLWLTYEEDLSSDPARGYERVCRFVGLEPCPVAVRYGKTNPHPLSEIVDNLEEVERALGGTRYEWMLYE